jgi:hypothetical protein
VAVVGPTFKPTGPQLGEPPQPASAANAAHNISGENLFNVSISSPPDGDGFAGRHFWHCLTDWKTGNWRRIKRWPLIRSQPHNS